MNTPFQPLAFEWAPVTGMQHTPKTWYNYYDSALITTSTQTKGNQTTSTVMPMTVPTVGQLRNISDSRFLTK